MRNAPLAARALALAILASGCGRQAVRASEKKFLTSTTCCAPC